MGTTPSTTNAGDQAVYFTVGHYDLTQRPAVWAADGGTPGVVLELDTFRAVFDAAGETTIDTTGDVAPTVLHDVLDALPWKRTAAEERMRWLGTLADARGERVGWSTTKEATEV